MAFHGLDRKNAILKIENGLLEHFLEARPLMGFWMLAPGGTWWHLAAPGGSWRRLGFIVTEFRVYRTQKCVGNSCFEHLTCQNRVTVARSSSRMSATLAF